MAGAHCYVHIDQIISKHVTDSVESAVFPKPVIVSPRIKNEQAQTDSDGPTIMAQSKKPSLANEVERRK